MLWFRPTGELARLSLDHQLRCKYQRDLDRVFRPTMSRDQAFSVMTFFLWLKERDISWKIIMDLGMHVMYLKVVNIPAELGGRWKFKVPRQRVVNYWRGR